MSSTLPDIRWQSRLDPAATQARQQGRLLVVMGLLNGMGDDDAW
ncbi:MAG: hypothetical protein ACI8RZ_002275 [Myxococcota bacterium]|jgi:hypothetical protein